MCDDEEDESQKSTVHVKTIPDVPKAVQEASQGASSTAAKMEVDAQRDDVAPLHSPPNARPLTTPITTRGIPPFPTIGRRTESHRVPYFRYFGPTAIVPGFKQMVVSVRDRRRSTGGSAPGTSPLSTHSGAAGSNSAIETDFVAEDLPVYDPNDPAPVPPLTIQLVTTFFLQMGSSYPFLKKEKFIRLVKDKGVEPILVDSICALAARFSDAPALTGGNDKMPRTERGAVFAQRARQATVDTFPCPTVGAVQACLLMAYEGFGANQDSALWMYLGLAIRMAVDLGLQKEVGVQYQGDKDPYTRTRSRNSHGESPEDKASNPDSLSQEEQQEIVQERTDTFWAIFILDRVISSGTGRPVTFRDDDFELSFPEPFIDPNTNWPAPFPTFLQIIHLYGRVCDVLNNISDLKDLTQERWDRLNTMEHQLTRIYKTWDSRLQFNVSNFKAYLSFGQGTTFILLHFWFHALFIILHQPTILSPFGELRSELQLLPDSRELSMSSAKTICDILSFADLIDPKSFIGNPFTSQPIYIAACAFLMESSANTSAMPSRANSPRESSQADPSKPSGKPREMKPSRHSLLASAANQNYQRCYSSLQQIHFYWGGIKYILTALDQKAKGNWDCETYTMEEYESTNTNHREGRSTISSRFSGLENRTTPKATRPPIAWTLAGTANSPNSSLTRMYQNVGSPVLTNVQAAQQLLRQPTTPPGNMVYDPIRQSLPESGTLYIPAFSPQNASAMRSSPQQAMSRRLSNFMAARQPGRLGTLPEESQGTPTFLDPGLTRAAQGPGDFEGLDASSSGGMVDAAASSGGTLNNGLLYSQGSPYPATWGPTMGNMDSITFDSQDIDIGALGLEQDQLMGPWLNFLPEDILGLFDNPDIGSGGT